MTLEQIIRNRRGKAGSNGAWQVVPCNSATCLYHYSTLMLRWRDTGYGVEVLYMGTGHGSVSDQNGMNKAFRTLGLGYYFSRAGGADIRTTTSQEGIA